MDNKKDDAYYLEKIVNDLKFLIEHTSGKTKWYSQNVWNVKQIVVTAT